MSSEQEAGTVREAVGVFDNLETLEAAIDELESSGFDRAEISLVAGQQVVEKELGHLYEKVGELEDDPEVPRTAYVSRESLGDAEGALVGGLLYVGALTAAGAVVATGGALAAAIAAAAMAGGAGAAIGSALAAIIGSRDADYLQQQLDRGGLLLWVRTHDPAEDERAKTVLSKHSAHDVHVHGLSGASD